ncbi:hypothetical protein L596_017337 [Steinernema carpocapsae]|uniref:Reverse transcriptase domain-containing protein n=1 Tax=Steinernema carpocapsae TaxID=34508 RepID=A0A4U5N1C7_STECR|nr:hypothetical protein L596_017337 [Steinernema carpocapsae]
MQVVSVNVNGAVSSAKSVKSGVPQGFCQGPLLFALFINNICSIMLPKVHCTLFADDLRIYASSNPRALKKVLTALETWSAKWGLPIFKSKTLVVHVM